MRRAASILLLLAIWLTQSGLAGAIHSHDEQSGHLAGGHEGQCHVCAAVHAPAIHTGPPGVAVALLAAVDAAPLTDVSLTTHRCDRKITCRGPPTV